MIKIIGSLYVVNEEDQEIEFIQRIKCDEYIKDEYIKSRLYLIEKMKEGIPPDAPFICDFIKILQTEVENYKIKHPDYMTYRITINDKFNLEFKSKEIRDEVFQSCIYNITRVVNYGIKLNEDEPK